MVTIEPEMDDEDAEFHAVWVVEPV